MPGKLLVSLRRHGRSSIYGSALRCPFMLGFGVFPPRKPARFHLGFVAFSGLARWPIFRNLSVRARDRSIQDWVLADGGGPSAALHVLFSTKDCLQRPVRRYAGRKIVGVAGVLLLPRRPAERLGRRLMIVACSFLSYKPCCPWMPGIPLAIGGVSLSGLDQSPVVERPRGFRTRAGVSTSFVVPCSCCFPALCSTRPERATIHSRWRSRCLPLQGRAANAAVVRPAMTRLISRLIDCQRGTTGTFTIPMMKRVAFPPKRPELLKWLSGQCQDYGRCHGAAAFLNVEYWHFLCRLSTACLLACLILYRTGQYRSPEGP